jgi:hypothetical protein
LRERNIGLEIQNKIINKMDNLDKIQSEDSLEAIKLIQKIDPKIIHKVQKDFYGHILKSIPFFSNNFSLKIINKLSLKIQEKIYGPNEIIM